jgi:hypothetical protein
MWSWEAGNSDGADPLEQFDKLLAQVTAAVDAGDTARLSDAYDRLIVLSGSAARFGGQSQPRTQPHPKYPHQRVNELVHRLQHFTPQKPRR